MHRNETDKITEMLDGIEDTQKQKECSVLLEFFKDITQEEPELWNGGMIGFGRYAYKYESGREGEWFLTGFAPRKNNIAVYLIGDFNNKKTVLKEFGDYKKGSSCLYIKSIENIDLEKLRSVIKESIRNLKTKYPD